MIATGAATRVFGHQVGSIRISAEDHVTSSENEFGIRIAINEFVFVVIPIEMDSDILIGKKIDFEGIFFIHDADKVLDVVIVGVFDAKIVDHQCEGNFMSDMFE